MDDKLINLIDKYDFNKTVNFTRNLLKIKSLSGQEKEVVDLCIKAGNDFGFNESYADEYGNYIGKIVLGNGKGKKIVLTGHLDTVYADINQWNTETPPYEGIVKDNKIYGRGASDMKGQFATMFTAAAYLKQCNLPLNGEIYIVGTVVEELFEGVCFLEALKKIKPDYIIVGEATDGKINVAQRGRAEILITVFGFSKHASVGRTTINAIEQTAYIIDAFHRWYKSEAVELLGRRNIVPTDIKIPVGGGGGLDGRGGNSTVPNKVELTYDVRTIPGDTEESIIKLIKDNLSIVVENGKRKYPNFKDPDIRFASDKCVTYTGITIEQNKFAPAWKTEKDAEIVKKAISGLESAGIRPELGAYSFCTDGSAIINYGKLFPSSNCQIIGYGPSKESLAHTVNEYIEIDDMKAGFKGYIGIASQLLK